MVTSTLQITLPYPPEQVWQVVTDLTDTAWRSDIARVERTGPGAFVEYRAAAHGCALQRRSSPSAGGWGPL